MMVMRAKSYLELFTDVRVTLLLAIGVIVGLVGNAKVAVDRRRSQSQLIREVMNLGGRVQLVNGRSLADWSSKDSLELDLTGPIRAIDLSGTHVTDEILEQLLELSDIRYLDLSNTPITDRAMIAVSKNKQLNRLSLNHTAITDCGVAYLMDMANGAVGSLRWLELRGTMITDTVVDDLRRCRQRSVVDVRETRLTPIGHQALRNVTHLVNLLGEWPNHRTLKSGTNEAACWSHDLLGEWPNHRTLKHRALK